MGRDESLETLRIVTPSVIFSVTHPTAYACGQRFSASTTHFETLDRSISLLRVNKSLLYDTSKIGLKLHSPTMIDLS